MTKYGTDFVVGAIVAVGGGRIDISMCVSVCVWSIPISWKNMESKTHNFDCTTYQNYDWFFVVVVVMTTLSQRLKGSFRVKLWQQQQQQLQRKRSIFMS